MAEPDTTTAPAPDYNQLLQQLYQQTMAQPQAATGARAQVARPSSITGLLGSALGGGASGSVPVSADEADASGNRALLNFGLNLLANSGYRTDRPTIGQLIGGGIGAAQQSLGQSEALTAARGQAQQDYAQSQQEMKIARIKEALPILTLIQDQQRAAAARALSGQGNTNIGAAGTYEGAIGGHEGTGKNPASTAFGTGQFLESTWKDFAAANPDLFKGMTPDQVMAARSNPALGNQAITWLAQRNAGALGASGAPVSGQSLGIAHYVGPTAAASIMAAPDNAPVSSFVGKAALDANPELRSMTVGQMKARYANTPAPSFLATAKPGAPAVAGAPPAAVSVAPASTPSRVAPDTTQPDIAPTGGQVAGPGAPSNLVAKPPGPNVTGDVGAIAQGMINAGADPDTLKPPTAGTPGGSVPPLSQVASTGPIVPQPPVPAPSQPQAPQSPDIKVGDLTIRHPGTFADYYKQEYVPPPASSELYNPNLTPAEQSAFAIKQKALNDEITRIGLTYPAADQSKALDAVQVKRDALAAEIQTAVQNKARAAAAALNTYDDNQQKAIQTRYDLATGAYYKAFDQAQQGAETRLTEHAKVTDKSDFDTLQDFGKERERIDAGINNLTTLADLSDHAGLQTPLEGIRLPNGKTGSEMLTQWGFGDKAAREHWGAQQTFEAAKNQMIIELRKGVSMGQLSDKDMNFLQHMAPDLLNDPTTRKNIIALLEQQLYRKKAYMNSVEDLWDGGKGVDADGKQITMARAKRMALENLGDYVPPMPKGAGSWDVPTKNAWIKKNVPPRTIYRDPDGDLRVAPGGY